MPPKPNARNWNDVQTVIATTAIVATLSMWNLFATPAQAEEAETVQTEEKVPILPTQQPTEPPIEFPVDVGATALPQVKVMFTQVPTQTTTVVQQQSQQETKKKKKKKDNGGGGGGTAPVTQTQSS